MSWARRPGAPGKGAELCAVDELEATGARGLVFGSDTERFEMFVVRGEDGTPLAYVNECPHQLTPLETFENRFLNSGGEIICSTHGARFRRDDGLCTKGPCEGKKLEPVPIEVVDGMIRIA